MDDSTRRERQREINRRSYRKNREKRLAAAARYRAENREQIREADRLRRLQQRLVMDIWCKLPEDEQDRLAETAREDS